MMLKRIQRGLAGRAVALLLTAFLFCIPAVHFFVHLHGNSDCCANYAAATEFSHHHDDADAPSQCVDATRQATHLHQLKGLVCPICAGMLFCTFTQERQREFTALYSDTVPECRSVIRTRIFSPQTSPRAPPFSL